jgi:hypothetical protein
VLQKRSHIQIFTCIVILILLLAMPPLSARDWEGGFTVSVSYQELSGKDDGAADVTVEMLIPIGTPLLGKEAAIGSALSALKDIWNIKSVHEDVVGFLGPQIPMDVQKVVSKLSGSSFIMEVIKAFDTVENAGYSRLQSDISATATERLPIRTSAQKSEYPDAPRFYNWIVGGGPVGDHSRENWVLASMVNYSASLLSFRSELGRFPRSLAELRESGHLFIEPLNPYSGMTVKEVQPGLISKGDISYQYIDNNRVVLFTYVDFAGSVDVVRREINLYASGSFDLLYRQTAGLTENEKQVARYTFQISQILSEYYAQHHNLPFSVPQCETEGFAYVSFPNPYTGRDAGQAEALANVQPGDYSYHRISSSSYFLVGNGENGRSVLSISKDFGGPAPGPAPTSTLPQ